MKKITTYPNKCQSETIIIDAKNQILGKLAVQIANILRGKNKPEFSYHTLVGDKVIVKNAKYFKVTGRKLTDKKYYSHSGYLGNLKVKNLQELFKQSPEKVIRFAVSGMLPNNRLKSKLLNNLTICNDENCGV